MADVLVNGDVSTFHAQRGIVWLNVDTAYYFFGDDTNKNLFYTKTTDGGATWATAVLIISDSTDVVSIAIYWDRDSPGDLGTLIHIIGVRDFANNYQYRTLDTADDTLNTVVTAGSDGVGGGTSYRTSITKAFNGDRYMKFNDSGNQGFRRVLDGETSWAGRTDLATEPADQFFLFPDGNSADTADVILIRGRLATETIILNEFDASANSWTSTDIVVLTSLAGGNSMWAAMRASDKHIIVAVVDEVVVSSDVKLRIFDTFGSGSIVERTNIVLDPDKAGFFTGMVVAPNDDIYVCYIHEGTGTFDQDVKGVYIKSTDGGTTWGSEIQFTAGDGRNIDYFAIPGSFADGGLWAPLFVDLDASPRNVYINLDNAVRITENLPAFTVSDITITPYVGERPTIYGGINLFGAVR